MTNKLESPNRMTRDIMPRLVQQTAWQAHIITIGEHRSSSADNALGRHSYQKDPNWRKQPIRVVFERNGKFRPPDIARFLVALVERFLAGFPA